MVTFDKYTVPENFESDGCSLWPDGSWIDCCRLHDYLRSVMDKLQLSMGQTDEIFLQCMVATDHTWMGILMFTGLTLFGGIYAYFKKRKADILAKEEDS